MSEPRVPTWLPPEEYLRTLPKVTCYACLYFTDERGRPLQLRTSYPSSDVWQNPGGNLDPGETPWRAAVRETREETGLVVTGTRPLLLAHFVTPGPSRPFGQAGFLFDGGTLTDAQLDAIVLDPAEHREWSVRTVEEWRAAMNPRTFDRLSALDTARRTGVTGYLATVRDAPPTPGTGPGAPADGSAPASRARPVAGPLP